MKHLLIDLECNRWMRLAAALTFGAALAWLLDGPTVRLWQMAAPDPGPVEYLRVVPHPEAVEAGDEIVLTYSIIRHESCPANIHHFWVTQDGEAISRLRTVAGGYTRVGQQDVPVRLTVPHDAPPGPLAYRFTLTSFCENGTFVTPGPDAWITVLEGTAP